MIAFLTREYQQRCDVVMRFQLAGEICGFLKGVSGIIRAVEVEEQLLESRDVVTITVRIDREITRRPRREPMLYAMMPAAALDSRRI